MRRALSISLLALAAAPAAQAATPAPVVKSVSPLRASVGEVMTVSGRNFAAGEATNVVVFMNRAGRVVYVRAANATADSLSLRIPGKLERLLDLKNGVRAPTRFRVKVISTKMGKVATSVLARPTIGPDVGGDCDKDGSPNPVDADDDNDFMLDDEEKKARTNPCGADSDGDGLLDGWEYLSALDLNRNALPYPGKKPFPNALFPDAEIDYDGDGLSAWAEHAMWLYGERKRPLSYSDGDQDTVSEPQGSSPWDYGAPWGELSDDERDFDKDGLANIVELRSPRLEPWQNVYGSVRPNFMDPDTDGDGLNDGLDDQDHDDVSNLDELHAGTWAMNPCDPLGRASRTCPRWITDGLEPVRPKNLCLSQTIARGGNVPYFKLPEKDEEAVVDPDKELTAEDVPCFILSG